MLSFLLFYKNHSYNNHNTHNFIQNSFSFRVKSFSLIFVDILRNKNSKGWNGTVIIMSSVALIKRIEQRPSN